MTTTAVTSPTMIHSPFVIESIYPVAIMADHKTPTPSSQKGKRAGDGFEPGAPVIIGLGGNQGDVRATLSGAVHFLKREFGSLRVSPLYQSRPVGPPQPDFLNATVLLDYPHPLLSLLRQLQDLEASSGRVRAERWGPRTLDLDILWAGARELGSSTLTVPHASLDQRAFALRPLLDVFPALTRGVRYRNYQRLLASLGEGDVFEVAAGAWWEALS